MQIATAQKVVNALSPARRVPDMRRTAVQSNVIANPVRPLYERLHRPTFSRTRLAATSVAAKSIKLAPRVLASRTITRAAAPRVPRLLARARADYKQNGDGTIGQTRIPKPIITAVRQANVRRQSRLWAKMTSVIVRRSARAPAAELATEVEEVEEELYEESEKLTMEFEEPALEMDEPADNDMDNTSLMFNDNSFDESISPDQQSSAFNIFGRKMVSMKRLGMALRTNRDSFVGLSRCPDYTGESVGLQRVRSRTVDSGLRKDNEVEGSAIADVPASTKIPASRLPVAKPKPVVVTKIAGRTAISKTISKVPAKTVKRQMTSPKTKSTSSSLRNVAIPKSRKAVAPAAILRKSKPVSKPLSTSKSTSLASSERGISRPIPKRSAKKVDARPSSKAKAALKSIVRKPKAKAVEKHVCIVEGPIEPRFYSTEDTVKQSTAVVDGSVCWEPLTGLFHSQQPSTGKGTTQIFEGTVNCALTIKRRFLNRYASVRRYEARRREEALAHGQRPAMGQLEYGNGDVKIAMQASGVITADDIGMLQDLSAIGKAGKLLGDSQAMVTLVLVFGTFREPFENAVIPAKGVKAYKKPLRWPAAGSEIRLEKFAEQHLKVLQAADLVA